MKIVILSEQPTNTISGLEQFCGKLEQECGENVVCLRYTPGESRDIIGEIRTLQPAMLITADLPGFEQCTLTDNVSYNLLDCKQLHLLLHRNLPNEPYLAGQLSIAMFFYCAGDTYYEYLTQKYPNLPYLKKLPAWGKESEDMNARALYEAFEEVLHEING